MINLGAWTNRSCLIDFALPHRWVFLNDFETIQISEYRGVEHVRLLRFLHQCLRSETDIMPASTFFLLSDVVSGKIGFYVVELVKQVQAVAWPSG